MKPLDMQFKDNLINFLKTTLDFTQRVSTIFLDPDVDSDQEGLVSSKHSEQQSEAFFLLAFALINIGERISKLSDGAKKFGSFTLLTDLSAIRNSFSHKLYLIEPSNYLHFIQRLESDLQAIDFPALESKASDVFLTKLPATIKFLQINDKRIMTKESNIPLFLYWINQYNLSYQKAMIGKPLPDSLNTVCLSLVASLQTFENPSNYVVIPSLSLAIMLGSVHLTTSSIK